MDLVVFECDVVLVDVVPLLDANLLGPSPCLGSHKLLQVPDGVVLIAFHAHLLPQPVVQHNLDHRGEGNSDGDVFCQGNT